MEKNGKPTGARKHEVRQFFPNINLNWIPLATAMNCAQEERPERRIRICGSFLRLGGQVERVIQPGATRLFPTMTCPLSAGTDGNLGHDTCPSQLKTGHQQRAGGPSLL